MTKVHFGGFSNGGTRVGVFVLFSLFALVGAVATCFMFVRPVIRVREARSWPAVPCHIVSSEVGRHRGNKGSTTYSVDIRYRYTVNGRDLESSRYDFLGGSSSGRESKVAIVSHHPAGSEATCYVNPQDPSDAVLERGFTPAMWVGLLPLAFLFAGVGGVTWGISASKPRSRPVAGVAPWLTRPDWAAGRVESGARKKMIGFWVFAVFWNAVSWAVALVALQEIPKSKLAWLVLLLPLIGVALICGAIYTTIQWRKFGESELELTSVPGVIGGALEGNVRLSANVRPLNGFKLKLACVRVWTTGSGKHRHTHQETLWEQTVQTGDLGVSDTVPVHFEIPPECEPTRDGNPRDRVFWRLEIKADMVGVDYSAAFDVPVFRTTQSA